MSLVASDPLELRDVLRHSRRNIIKFPDWPDQIHRRTRYRIMQCSNVCSSQKSNRKWGRKKRNSSRSQFGLKSLSLVFRFIKRAISSNAVLGPFANPRGCLRVINEHFGKIKSHARHHSVAFLSIVLCFVAALFRQPSVFALKFRVLLFLIYPSNVRHFDSSCIVQFGSGCNAPFHLACITCFYFGRV